MFMEIKAAIFGKPDHHYETTEDDRERFAQEMEDSGDVEGAQNYRSGLTFHKKHYNTHDGNS